MEDVIETTPPPDRPDLRTIAVSVPIVAEPMPVSVLRDYFDQKHMLVTQERGRALRPRKADLIILDYENTLFPPQNHDHKDT